MGHNSRHIEAAARAKLGAAEEWAAYSFEVIGQDFILQGSVPVGIYSRGPRKGSRKWEGQGTKVVVTHAEVEAEEAKYIKESGNCHVCLGKGLEWVGWSIETGVMEAPCESCKATGKSIGYLRAR
jgi:hypothetical protein